MNRLLACIAFVLAVVVSRAEAAPVTVPYTFVPFTTIQSSQVNADFNALASGFNNVDNTNIGAAGIYASQVIPTTTAQGIFGGTSATQYQFPGSLNVVGWSEFRLSTNYGGGTGCGISDATTQINTLLSLASASAATSAGARVILDCDSSVSGVLTIPTGANNLIIDGGNNPILMATSYNGDLFQLPATGVSQSNINITMQNINIIANGSGNHTAGAAFNFADCSYCTFAHIRYAGHFFDLMKFGSPTINGGVNVNTTNTSINDVQPYSVTGAGSGYAYDRGIQFLGPSGGIWFTNSELQGPSTANNASIGFVADDSAQIGDGTLNDWNFDVFYIDDVDIERMGTGYYLNSYASTIDDWFWKDDIIDTLRGGPGWQIQSTGARPVFRFKWTNMWAGSNLANNSIWKFSSTGNSCATPYASSGSSGTNGMFDMQIIGGYGIESATGTNPTTQNVVSIGKCVAGVALHGFHAEQSGNQAGVYDDGINTSIEGSIMGNASNGAQNAVGVYVGADAKGTSIVGNDLRGNTAYAVQTVSGAGTTSPVVVTSNNVGCSLSTSGTSVCYGTNPFNFAAGSFVQSSGNGGDAGTLNSVPCTAFDDVTQAGYEACIDTSGNAAFAGNVSTARLNQSAVSSFAKRLALSAGVGTFTFPTAYNTTPVCTAVEEDAGAFRYLVITSISTTAVSVNSSATTGNTDAYDVICVGNPN